MHGDPKNWSRPAASAIMLGLDIGMAQDHSALISAGAWTAGGRSIIGVFDARQFQLGTPLDEVADVAAATACDLRAKIVFDASNNSAFASLLAARMGARPATHLVAGVITNALDHAAQPVPMILSLGGMCSAIPRWTLSKRELVESIAAEIDSGTMVIGREGDWETLRDELGAMERTIRQSGSVAYSAPTGKHDDMVMALALAAFGLRRVGGNARRHRPRSPPPNVAAWT
jgi:hypothetical protein